MSHAKYVLSYIKLISRARRSKMTGVEKEDLYFQMEGEKKPTKTQQHHKKPQNPPRNVLSKRY